MMMIHSVIWNSRTGIKKSNAKYEEKKNNSNNKNNNNLFCCQFSFAILGPLQKIEKTNPKKTSDKMHSLAGRLGMHKTSEFLLNENVIKECQCDY